jgi:ATP-dependent Clp protease ATP-binding subunit ClpC
LEQYHGRRGEAQQKRTPKMGCPVFGPFSDDFKLVMMLANEEAQRLHHDYIGTEHLLLGLLKEEHQVASSILKNLGVDPERIRQEGESQTSKGPDGRAKSAVEHAMSEAQNLRHEEVGPEHLLLGLLREQDGVAGRVLTGFGVTLEAARAEVEKNNQ